MLKYEKRETGEEGGRGDVDGGDITLNNEKQTPWATCCPYLFIFVEENCIHSQIRQLLLIG